MIMTQTRPFYCHGGLLPRVARTTLEIFGNKDSSSFFIRGARPYGHRPAKYSCRRRRPRERPSSISIINSCFENSSSQTITSPADGGSFDGSISLTREVQKSSEQIAPSIHTA